MGRQHEYFFPKGFLIFHNGYTRDLRGGFCVRHKKCQCTLNDFIVRRGKWTSLKCIWSALRTVSMKHSFLLLFMTQLRSVHICWTCRGNAFPISSLASPSPTQGIPYLSYFAFRFSQMDVVSCFLYR